MKKALAAFGLAVALLGGACSGDDDGAAPGTGETTQSSNNLGSGGEADLKAAVEKTADAESFRFEGSGQQKELSATQALVQRVKGEFVAPDRIHLARLALDSSPQIDLWFADGNVWQQLPGGGSLSCGKSPAEGLSDPRNLLRALAGAAEVKGGEKGYTFTLSNDAANALFGAPQGGATYTSIAGDAAVVDGLITSVHVTAKTTTHELRADLLYSDVNDDDIEVTPPEGCDPAAQPEPTTTTAP